MADSSTSPPSPTTTPDPSSTLSTSFTPTGTRDSAPGSHNENDNDDTGGVPMASYYFVFLMLALCIIGIVIFLNFRRRRKRRLQILYGRDDAFAQDPAASRGGRYWPGRWGSTNVSREEGLNEHGEAPPPYMPKSTLHDVQRDGGNGGQAANAGVAVPMQTLTRDDAGLRPPEYEEAGGHDDMMRPTRGAASSSQHAETR